MAKQPKLKTYVLTFSRHFALTHPRAGEETNFIELVNSGDKQHTVRGNYALWEKRAKEVQAGRAVVSLRYWTASRFKGGKQIVFGELSHIAVQKVHIYNIKRSDEMDRFIYGKFKTEIFIDNSIQPLRWPFKFAARDGLTMSDFLGWFKKPVEDAALIHFSNFKY